MKLTASAGRVKPNQDEADCCQSRGHSGISHHTHHNLEQKWFLIVFFSQTCLHLLGHNTLFHLYFIFFFTMSNEQ